ncbi:MAG: sialidase family protein [Vicinamibacteraceae bacterium]
MKLIQTLVALVGVSLFGAGPTGQLAGGNEPAPARAPGPPKHLVVYQREGRFAGWPANHGAWSWDGGREMLVGFDAGEFERRQRGHAIKRTVTPQQLLARSRDGGESWTIEQPPDLELPSGVGYQDSYPAGNGRPLSDCPGGLDFEHPDMAFTARMTRNPGVSRFYYSTDRGKRWSGPYRLPDFGHTGTAARTDYLVSGKHELSLFITLAKSNGREGRPGVISTADGGKTWRLVSYIGPEPPEEDYAIMPATVRVDARTLFTAVRHRGFLELFRSTDNGRTWVSEDRSIRPGRGNPASLIELRDGRLALTYGYRAEPFGIRARLSKDGGRTWSPEIVLRDDGGNDDLGYPRSIERPDGKIVTVYYYNTNKDEERFIAATIWDPDA